MDYISLFKSKNLKDRYYITGIITDENKQVYMMSLITKKYDIKDIMNKTLEEIKESYIYMITPLILQDDLNWVEHLDIHKKTMKDIFLSLNDEKRKILDHTIIKVREDIKNSKFNESQNMFISYPTQIKEYLMNKINDEYFKEVENIITQYTKIEPSGLEVNEEEFYTSEMIEEITTLSSQIEKDYIESISENLFVIININELWMLG